MASWWTAALTELHAHARDRELRPTGPAGGIFDEALYQQERAQAMVHIPMPEIVDNVRRIRSVQVPAADLVITTYHGPAADIDLAYADLGSYLAEHHLHLAHRIREHYLSDHLDTPDQTRWQTEIAWPIQPR